MIGQGLITMKQNGSKHDMLHVSADLVAGEPHPALMLDGMGRIRSCGQIGERIFGTTADDVVGKRISDFITGLHLGGSSPSYAARYLVHLCGEGEWHGFEAVDAGGKRFPVELNLSRSFSEGNEVFLLNLRHPGGDW